MLPSFYTSGERPRVWRVGRAAAYGCGIGVLAALFKTMAPLPGAISVSGHGSENLLANTAEIVGAALGFAFLFAAAAAVRNAVAQRLIWPET